MNMNNDVKTNNEIEDSDFQIEDESDQTDALSIYNLSKEEMAIADAFAHLVKVISNSGECDIKDHLAALIKYTGNRILVIRNNLGNEKDEIENQKLDLEHELVSAYPNTDEFNSILRAIGDTILERRVKKDIWMILSVMSTNLNKTGNFILGMRKRAYAPRSNKYKENEYVSNNTIGKRNNPTTMKFNNIKK